MIVKGKTLIILILICLHYFTFANENCDCDTLQIHYSGDPKNYYNLTKQSKIINGKPFYFSLDAYLLWWSNGNSSWEGNPEPYCKILPNIQVDKDLSCLSVSDDQKWTQLWKGDKGVIESKCLRRNDGCSAVRQESGKLQDTFNNENKLFQWEATYRATCIFPFQYNNKTYHSCTKENYDQLWCATSTDAVTSNLRQWGYCDESCLIQDTKGSSDNTGKYWLILLLVVLCISVFSIVVICYHYVKQRNKTKSFKKYAKDECKEYDIFVSYNTQEKVFVEEFLVPKLEDNYCLIRYKCLLHVRDFVPGISIMNQIENAVQSSSCTMIVLSKDFVKSQWACNGFEYAISRNKVIVVLKGKLPAKEKMPESIQNYIRNNKYLESSDPNLLVKLKQLIPLQGSREALFNQEMAQSGPITEPRDEDHSLFKMDAMNLETETQLENQVTMSRDESSGMINLDLFLNDQASHLSYNSKHEVDQSKFVIGKQLGGGNFGNVCEGHADDLIQLGCKTKIAIKTVNDPLDRSQVYALMCEIKVLSRLDKHLNLVNMLGACTKHFNTGQLWLLLEFCPHGDMKTFLLNKEETLKQSLNTQISINGFGERIFVKWAHSIAKGMEYLSTKRIMHGDLAARNILIGISDGKDNNYIAKVSDFGLSKAFYDKTSYTKEDRKALPWKWMDIYYLETGRFTLNSDVWSFGVVLWEMLSLGRLPYAGLDANITINEITSGFRLLVPAEISKIENLRKMYNEATTMCWQLNPKERWSFSDLVLFFETYLTADEQEEYKRIEQLHLETKTIENESIKE